MPGWLFTSCCHDTAHAGYSPSAAPALDIATPATIRAQIASRLSRGWRGWQGNRIRSDVQIVFTVNGPGEISGWLFPLTRILRDRMPEARITVCLLPCVFSSGAEVDVVGRLDTVDEVLSVSESLALITLGRGAAELRKNGPLLVFHLGGEPALSLALGARLGCEVHGYVERPPTLNRGFRKLYYSGLETLPEAVEDRAAGIVGELMVDAVRLRRIAAPKASPGRVQLGIFPGSRAFMVDPAIPFFAALVDKCAPRWPHVDWVIARSDHIALDHLKQLSEIRGEHDYPTSSVSFHDGPEGPYFVTEAGNRIDIRHGLEVVASADYAISFPGTVTGELGASGVPMVVMMPTDHDSDIPLPGLAGHIGRIPWIGPRIKRMIGYRMLKDLPLLALPNRRAGRELVPELVGRAQMDDIIAALAGLIENDTSKLKQQLRAVMGHPGAAETLANEIAAYFASRQANAVQART